MNPAIARNVGPWAVFFAFFLFLGFANTSYWKIADLAYMSLAFAFIAVISSLVVRERWRNLNNPAHRYAHPRPDAGDRFPRAVKRWCGDDKNAPD